MSRDGYLPDGLTDAMFDAHFGDHLPGCPSHSDADEVFECGGHNEHFCLIIDREINGCKLVKQDCKCDEIRIDREASKVDAAEARAEERRYARD